MAAPEQQRKPLAWEYKPHEIAATDVSYEKYLADYAHDFYEWDNGLVVKLSPVHEKHDILVRYLVMLLMTYFDFRPIGLLREEPFVMRLAAQNHSPEPDIQIILKTNPHELKSTMMDGPADICIEVISPESGERDRGRKFYAYEAAGVREYWMLDPVRTEPLFYRLDSEGHFIRQSPDADGYYRTPLLPGFALHVPTLWLDKPPSTAEILRFVEQMLADEN